MRIQECFLAGVARRPATVPPLLSRQLEEIVSSATLQFPKLALPVPVFMAFLGQRLQEVDELGRLATNDLYLACACVNHVPGAMAAFEQLVRRDLAAVLARVPRQEHDDLVQAIRLKLFTGSPPGLTAYSGLGSVKGWFRVTAARVVLNAVTRDQAPLPVDEDALLEQLSPTDDPELNALKLDLTRHFHEVLQVAFRALTPRERNLLRYAVGQGATVDQIAAVFNTHRSSASRWVVAARSSFADHVLIEVERRWGTSTASARKILQLVNSQLDLSWSRLAATETKG